MEFTNHQLLALNAKCPAQFKIEAVGLKDSRPASNSQRRCDRETLECGPAESSERPQRRKRPPQAAGQDWKHSEAYLRLHRVLQQLKTHPSASPFLYPVDSAEVQDYSRLVEDPMDLSTVESKLENGEYDSAYCFAMDVKQIWNNSFFFNAKTPSMYRMTMEMSEYFEQVFAGHEKLILGEKKEIVQELYKKVERLSRSKKEPPKSHATDKPMNTQEKSALCSLIKALPPKYLSGLLDLVQDSPSLRQCEQFELDIELLPPKMCRKVEAYVRQCFYKMNSGKLGDLPPSLEVPADDSSASSHVSKQ